MPKVSVALYADGLSLAMVLLTTILTPLIIFSSFGTTVTNAKNFYRRFTLSDSTNFPPLNEDPEVQYEVVNMRFIGTAGVHAQFDRGAGVELFFVYDSCSKQGPASATTAP